MKSFTLMATTVLLASACAVNPVTGKNELSLLSTGDEVAIGEKNYPPSLQAQGGVYHVDLELQRYVSDVGNRLAAVSDNPQLPYEFSVINNPTPNAWALPGGKIAINRGLLLHLNDEAQLAAVLAHEIVHAAARHGAAQQSRGTLMQIGLGAIQAGSEGRQYQKYTDMASSLGMRAWLARYGRDDELESDRYGMIYMARAGYEPLAAVELQQTFLALSGEGDRDNQFSALFSSHPPSLKRVKANQLTARSLVAGARFKRRFDAAMSGLTADAPAYKAARRASIALSKNDPENALRLLDQAVAAQPAESDFWRLRGDAWMSLKNLDNAELAYTTAISKNPRYYLGYLRRGELRYQRGAIDQGLIDIQRSYDLLATAKASYYLGITAQKRDQLQRAEGYLSAAANASGDVGERARRALSSLRLSTAPERFFKVDLGVNERGLLRVRLRNTSQAVLRAMQLRVIDLHRSAAAEVILPVNIVLSPGASGVLETGIGPVSGAQLSGRFQAEVVTASLVE